MNFNISLNLKWFGVRFTIDTLGDLSKHTWIPKVTRVTDEELVEWLIGFKGVELVLHAFRENDGFDYLDFWSINGNTLHRKFEQQKE